MKDLIRHQLPNGLSVLIYPHSSSAIACCNLLYNVGSRHESPEKTGFAHLFEHLMFEGSLNIEHFDTHLQKAGGENNAFTSKDITNYYITLPPVNLETALWLESDRMLGLQFSEKKLETQKNVVIEEFNQRYKNQPYGDSFALLQSLAYKKHSYKWPTIGRDMDHIRNATMQDVKDFFLHHYAPNNAILAIGGNIDSSKTIGLVEKWFGSVPSRKIAHPIIPIEPEQKERHFLSIEREVPSNAIYMAFHMAGRTANEFYVADLISDILANGKSARLYQRLVKENHYFREINAYITGDIDPGLFIISGQPAPELSLEEAEKLIWEELTQLKETLIPEKEMTKVKNKYEAVQQYTETSLLHKLMQLSYHELLGGAELFEKETERYQAVQQEDVIELAGEMFRDENASVLYYKAKK